MLSRPGRSSACASTRMSATSDPARHWPASVANSRASCADTGWRPTLSPATRRVFRSSQPIGQPRSSDWSNACIPEAQMKRLGALLGSALFLVLAPGTVALYVPWLLSRWHVAPALLGFTPFRWIGIVLIVAGLPVLLDSFARFA